MKKSAGILVLSLLAALSARAVILLDTGDPTANTTAPAGTLADSGWQFEGDWGSFLGTPISFNFFVSAAHIGQADSHFFFAGSSYNTLRSFSLPGSDLLIWQVDGTFPYFASLYTKDDEMGKHLVVIGRGTRRGSESMLNGTLRGWNWGDGDGIRRWGENDIAEIMPYGGHDLLYATFDQHAVPNDRPNESHLSSGDSGGAIFISDGAAWKVAAINFAVDDLYTAPSADTMFTAAIFDARGFYTSDGKSPPTFTQISGPSAVPTGFYGSRISSELAWICSVIADPQVGREGNFLTLTYSKLLAPASDILYTVQTSDDLAGWQPANTTDETISVAGDIARIKSKIDPGAATHLFARLLVTRP